MIEEIAFERFSDLSSKDLRFIRQIIKRENMVAFSELPRVSKKEINSIIGAMDLTDFERKVFREFFVMCPTENFIKNPNRNASYKPGVTSLHEYILSENNDSPYSALISEGFCTLDEFIDNNKLSSTTKVDLTDEAINDIVIRFCKLTNKVKIVDPYLSLSSGSFESLANSLLVSLKKYEKLTTIEFHSTINIKNLDFFIAKIKSHVIPKPFCIKYFPWRKGFFHDRYLLTQQYGITSSAGFGTKTQSGVDRDIALLSSLSSKIVDDKWKFFEVSAKDDRYLESDVLIYKVD